MLRTSFGRIRPGHPTTSYPGVAQLVARLLWEQDAAGSNPVTRTTFLRKTACLGGFSSFCKTATTGYARGSKKGMPIRRKDKPPSVE